MEITLLAVGKLRPDLRGVADDYLRRLERHVKFHEVDVKEASHAPTVESQRNEEAKRLDSRRPGGSTLVALARGGSAWSSEDLAREVRSWQLSARPVALAIGGSHGLGDDFLARAQGRWSLGPLTLPHELARVIVLEQLYRAFTILGGTKYHKGR
ncbi:MAG: 23S rRNA (pseudouridine(1915)-N(3))-methyltransferase RlmH [Gemmatimonadales bacterium]